jgi:hypothetical protein
MSPSDSFDESDELGDWDDEMLGAPVSLASSYLSMQPSCGRPGMMQHTQGRKG